MTFAATDFSPRRGVSDEHIPQRICEERATKSGRKRPAALRVAPNLACGFVARRLQPHGRGCALLAPRHRPNWAQRTPSYLCLRPLSRPTGGRTEDDSPASKRKGRGEEEQSVVQPTVHSLCHPNHGGWSSPSPRVQLCQPGRGLF